MTTLTINGQKVKVSDDFLKLSPEQQNATVDEIARSMGAVPPQGQSPAMADGMAALSALSRPERAPYENSLPATAAQFGVGTQSGIANTLGFPVDALTGAINGVGDLTGLWNPIQNPVGGSGTFNAMFAPLNESIPEPQTATERYARRIGEEVGGAAAMAPVGLPMAASRGMAMPYVAAETASALGSGTAAQTAREYLPGNPWAEMASSLMGGGLAGLGAVKAMGAGGTDAVIRGGIEDQKMRAADAYDVVRADTRVLPQDSVDDMALGISERMDAARMKPRLHPGSAAILDAILQDSSGPMRIEDIEDLRRITTQSLPATAADGDRRLATIMTDEITDYLDKLDDPVADALVDGRNAHRRVKAAEAVADAAKKAERQAAKAGSGGNEINAMRQRLSSIIETPRKSRSFTAEELSAMDDIVMGTTGQNTARRLSRMAPSSGGLSAMLGIGGAMASAPVALPIMATAEAAKFLGERSTRKSIADLLQSLAPDRVIKPKEEGLTKLITALLAGRTMAGGE